MLAPSICHPSCVSKHDTPLHLLFPLPGISFTLCWSVFVYLVSPLPPQDHNCWGPAGFRFVHCPISRAGNSTWHIDNICWENNMKECFFSKWGKVSLRTWAFEEKPAWCELQKLSMCLSGDLSFQQGSINRVAFPPLWLWIWQEVRQMSWQMGTKMSSSFFTHITNICWMSTMGQLRSRGYGYNREQNEALAS